MAWDAQIGIACIIYSQISVQAHDTKYHSSGRQGHFKEDWICMGLFNLINHRHQVQRNLKQDWIFTDAKPAF